MHYFCVRIKSNLKVVKQLEASGQSDGIFHFKASKRSYDKAFRKRFVRSFRVRVMKFQFGKETVYLMTNLFSTRKYPKWELGMLYHQRWQVEESYKIKKCRLKIEQFSGFSPEIIRQGFHAKVFSECLASTLTFKIKLNVTHKRLLMITASVLARS